VASQAFGGLAKGCLKCDGNFYVMRKLKTKGRKQVKLYFHSPAFCSFLIFLLMRSRFSALTCEMKSLPFK
jgi:hypothetical protein